MVRLDQARGSARQGHGLRVLNRRAGDDWYLGGWIPARHATRARGRSHRGRVEHSCSPDQRLRHRQTRPDLGTRPYDHAIPVRGVALLLGHAIPKRLSLPLETAVGVMLVVLGADVLWRLWRERVHFHRHSHRDGTAHLHLHAHPLDAASHPRCAHDHAHGFRWRTLFVGLVHGMAGSAALLVLTVAQASTARDGLIYMLLFGVGSMIGMAALSSMIAIPLVMSARLLTSVNQALQLIVGSVAIGIGGTTIYSTALAG